MLKRSKKWILSVLIISAIIIFIWFLYTQVYKRVLVTFVLVHASGIGDYSIELYSDGSSCMFDTEYEYVLEKGMFYQRHLVKNIDKSRGKIPKEELKDFMRLLDDLQRSDNLYKDTSDSERILYNGVLYKAGPKRLSTDIMYPDEFDQTWYKGDEWALKVDKVYGKLFYFGEEYLYPGD